MVGVSAGTDSVAASRDSSASAAPMSAGAVQRRRPVLADVAARAGVSPMTVSRVLHGHRWVHPDTRAKVLTAIAALNYAPNGAARTLVTGRSCRVGVLCLDTALDGPASALFGIEQTARMAGYHVWIATLGGISKAAITDAMEEVRIQGVDGLVVIAPQESAARVLAYLPDDVPVVALEGGSDWSVPVIGLDQRLGAALATQHLVDLGHRDVWHIAGPVDRLEAVEREVGWRETLTRNGLSIHEPICGDWSPRSGFDAARTLVRRHRPTAIFVANDEMAVGVLHALHGEGVRVPEDVSVVGFDDMPHAAYLTPPLTTIRQDFDDVGRRTFDLLLGLIENHSKSDDRVLIEPELVVRGSTSVCFRNSE